MSEKPKKPRPIAADNPHTAATTIFIDPALRAELDEWVAQLNAGGAGPKWTRMDVIRASLARAVRERGKKGREP